MNKIYKIIRSHKNGSIVVVSELAKGNKKSLTGKLLALAVGSMALATTALAHDRINNFCTTDNCTINLGDGETFSGNNITKNDHNNNAQGGGIYSYFRSDSSSPSSPFSSSVRLGNNATFTNNTVGSETNTLNEGGAIYSHSSNFPAYSFVTLGNNATFIGNIAGGNGSQGGSRGGGILSSKISLDSGAYFYGNRVGNGSGISTGGAIYSNYSVSLKGNSFFEGNLAEKGTDSLGGAIYLNGLLDNKEKQSTAKFNTDAGVIAFKNNYVNVEKDATEGERNSIYLNKNTVLDLTGNGNIYFDDPIYSGKEVGNNSLVKKGTGFVQFAGKNYLNTAGGKSVDIQEGTFRVVADASFETSSDGVFKVAEGATLAGGGTITAKEFNISGNISIDSAKFEIPEYDTVSHTFGTENTKIKDSEQTGNLTLVGDVNFENSAYFNVKVNPADENNKVNDLLSVEGTVQLGGATVRNIGYYGAKPNRSLENRTWTILKAGSIDGKFSGVESVYAMLTGELDYTTDSVTLALTRTSSFDSFSQTYNQNSVAGALDSLNSSSLVYGSITNIIGDANSVRDAYDSLSGEIHAGLHGALMDGERHFASTMLDRLSGREFKKAMNNEVVTDKLDGQNYFWVTSNGFRSETDKTTGNAKAVFKGGGLTMGGESERDNLTLGGAFHYGHSDYKLDSRNSKADIDSFKVAGYGAYQMDSWRFKAGASYGFHQIDSKRYVSVTDEHVKTDYDMHTVQLFGEVANSFNFNLESSHQAVIEPYIGLGWNLSHSESFKEQGGNASLNSKAKNNDNVNSTIGGRFFYKPTATVSLGADLNWQHIYGGRHTESEFTIDGSDRFTIQGARLDRDSFGAKLDAGIQITPTVNLKAGYQGRLAGNSSYNGGFVSAEVKF